MNKNLLFIQLAALVACTCAQQLQQQQQQQQFGAGVESPELLRRRQEFQAAARATAQSQKTLQEDFQRSVALANRERQDLFQQQQQQQQQPQQQQQQQQLAQRVAGGAASRQQFLSSPVEQTQQRVVVPAPAPAPALQRHQLGQKVLSQDRLADREEELFRQQALSAKYTFNSAINDGIMDNTHTREETRDGLKVSGSYSYSDGYFHRTVFYEADENGYRVVKEETEPIGNGPLVDLMGSADVSTNVDGVDSQYRITAADIGRFNKVREEPAINVRRNL